MAQPDVLTWLCLQTHGTFYLKQPGVRPGLGSSKIPTVSCCFLAWPENGVVLTRPRVTTPCGGSED
jgi:hypothetical protein